MKHSNLRFLIKLLLLTAMIHTAVIFFIAGMLFNNSYEVIAVKQMGCLLNSTGEL